MINERQTYYVTLATGEISQISTASDWNYTIYANNEEIEELREIFNENRATDWGNYFRAHVPYLEYHHDKGNDIYDRHICAIYDKLYELGDENAKAHIEQILPLLNRNKE
ncbi:MULTISPECIES: hypothetical protein [Priestia]|jgi:hypothetical protein|uniref:Hydrolase n=2 Tax=Priestia TaxID=2800373 RepID=A0A0H4KK55_9BACI|nr:MULTISPECIES: hypothetical protein [Priestia]AKO94497.1 hydrolase [Priestia filamentosa]KAB2490425.1 hydrolase [Priestia endophytica]MCM3540001.1 hydrolase [Priestia endophytica]MCY8234385.1 hydrolase [Priestia endophytica]MDT3764794.1 hydrolase [Priestia filamentosa]